MLYLIIIKTSLCNPADVAAIRSTSYYMKRYSKMVGFIAVIGSIILYTMLVHSRGISRWHSIYTRTTCVCIYMRRTCAHSSAHIHTRTYALTYIPIYIPTNLNIHTSMCAIYIKECYLICNNSIVT